MVIIKQILKMETLKWKALSYTHRSSESEIHTRALFPQAMRALVERAVCCAVPSLVESPAFTDHLLHPALLQAVALWE